MIGFHIFCSPEQSSGRWSVQINGVRIKEAPLYIYIYMYLYFKVYNYFKSVYFIFTVFFQRYVECTNELKELYEDKDGYVILSHFFFFFWTWKYMNLKKKSCLVWNFGFNFYIGMWSWTFRCTRSTCVEILIPLNFLQKMKIFPKKNM
jgi:hypothetical protein